MKEKLNLEEYEQQQKYLNYLRGLGLVALKKLHRRKFHGTKYWIKELNAHVPTRMRKNIWVRRLFLRFAAKHYHFPRGSEMRLKFLKHVRSVLQDDVLGVATKLDHEAELRKEIHDHSNFTEEQIGKMTGAHVDKIMSWIGINILEGVSVKRRKQALWEYFNKPLADTIPERPSRRNAHTSRQRQGEIVMSKGRPKNKYCLREYIIEDSELNFDDFASKYKKEFPHLSRGSFNVTKCILRKDGYDIPLLRAGRPSTKPVKEASKKKPTKGKAPKKGTKKKTKKKAAKKSSKKKTSKKKSSPPRTKSASKARRALVKRK